MAATRSSSSRTSLSFAEGGVWRVETTTTTYVVDLTSATLSCALTVPTSAGWVSVRRRLPLLSFADCRVGRAPVWVTATDVAGLENCALMSPPVESISRILHSDASNSEVGTDQQTVADYAQSLSDSDAARLVETELGTQRSQALQGGRTLLWEQAVLEASILTLTEHAASAPAAPTWKVRAAQARDKGSTEASDAQP